MDPPSPHTNHHLPLTLTSPPPPPSLQCLEILLDGNVDPNMSSDDTHILNLAVIQGNLAIVQRLLKVEGEGYGVCPWEWVLGVVHVYVHV